MLCMFTACIWTPCRWWSSADLQPMSNSAADEVDEKMSSQPSQCLRSHRTCCAGKETLTRYLFRSGESRSQTLSQARPQLTCHVQLHSLHSLRSRSAPWLLFSRICLLISGRRMTLWDEIAERLPAAELDEVSGTSYTRLCRVLLTDLETRCAHRSRCYLAHNSLMTINLCNPS